jgi:hypothetical protein
LFSNAQRLDLSDVRGEGSAPVRTALSGLILESALTLEMSLKPNVGPQDSKNAERGSTAHAMTVLCGALGLLAMVSAPPVRGDAWSRDGPLVRNRSAALLMTSHRRRLTAQHTPLVISMVKRPQRLLLLFLFKPNPLPTLVWEVVRCCSLPRPSVSSFHSLPSLFSLLFDLVNNPNWMLLTSSKLSGIHQHTDGNRSFPLFSHSRSAFCCAHAISWLFLRFKHICAISFSFLPCGLIQLKLNLQSVSFPFNSNSFYSLLDFFELLCYFFIRLYVFALCVFSHGGRSSLMKCHLSPSLRHNHFISESFYDLVLRKFVFNICLSPIFPLL